MQIINHVKGPRGEAMRLMAAFCITYFYLRNSKYTLTLITSKDQVKETGAKGLTGCDGNNIIVCLDSRLNETDMLATMAHEMVHVQQIAKGTLIYRMDGDKEICIWCGKDCAHLSYLDRPWELRAMAQTEIIVRKFHLHIATVLESL